MGPSALEHPVELLIDFLLAFAFDQGAGQTASDGTDHTERGHHGPRDRGSRPYGDQTEHLYRNGTHGKARGD